MIDTLDAILLMQAFAFGGLSHLTLTGGDPSLRRDLLTIVRAAKRLGMMVEILTNGQHQTRDVREALLAADLVGLSLDGSGPTEHDAFRSKPGNYRRVISLMNFLDMNNARYVVRTVVSRVNLYDVGAIGDIIANRPGLMRWSLQQFSAIEAGFLKRDSYEISGEVFEKVATQVRDEFTGSASVSLLSDEAKIGLYLFVDPAGRVFSRIDEPEEGKLPIAGNLLRDHISELAEKISFDPLRHAARYDNWFAE